MGKEKLIDVALALADYADLKSPFQAGRSRRVADLAERIARRDGASRARGDADISCRVGS